MERSRLVDPDPTITHAPEPSAARLRAALAASLAAHVLAWGVLRIVREPRAPERPPPVLIDLDLAPIAPPAESLPPEEELAARRDEPAKEPEPGVPEPAPATETDGIGALDAGVDAAPPIDAGVDAAPPIDAGRRHRDAGLDAGVDAGVDAAVPLLAEAGDAGAGDAGGGAAAATTGDAGAIAVAVTEDGGAGDGGAGTDGGTIASDDPDRTGVLGASTTPGTGANLLTYAPAGHVVTMLARFDRLRGTEWAERVEAMLAPLPDHDALLGDEAVRLTDVFETLVISSPEPDRADATTLVARTRLTPAELRDLLDRPDARVRWTPAVGGALGRRLPSRSVIPGDPRVFLSWAPGWTTLTRPGDLPGLLAPSAGGLNQPADPARLPGWLERMQTIEAEAGGDDGPALMLTAAGMFPPRIDLPLVDADIPGPERATLTLTVDAAGFVVRGNLRYPDEAAAATAADALLRARQELLGKTLAKIALGSARALNAVRGLSVQRTGSRVAFATSISSGDARVLLARVGELIAARFDAMRAGPRPTPAPAPQPAAPRPDGGVP